MTPVESDYKNNLYVLIIIVLHDVHFNHTHNTQTHTHNTQTHTQHTNTRAHTHTRTHTRTHTHTQLKKLILFFLTFSSTIFEFNKNYFSKVKTLRFPLIYDSCVFFVLS